MMHHGEKIAYVSGLALLSIFLLILAILLIIFCRKKPVESEETLLPTTKPCAQAYQLTEIDIATDGFNHRRIIGQGRLGTVYAAVLSKGELVAVKRIHPRLVLSHAGFGFSSILRSLSLAQHANVVSILGYSQAPGERIVVMEFVGTVSLEYYLHGDSSNVVSLLDWSKRLKIAAAAARGLEYLHQGMTPNVVHGCVKPSNILLDDKFSPKLCDYGLSFLTPNEKGGILGYVDEEYWVKGGGGGGVGACKESDVYGFGVVLLEILSGRRSEEGLLVKWATPLIKEKRFGELLDPRLVMPCDLNPLVRLARVALACVGNSRKSRPPIPQVAAILNTLEHEVCH